MSVDFASESSWTGVLPRHWSFHPLGRLSWIRARLGWRGLTADEYVDDGVPMLATPDIKHASIDFKGANRITLERYNESPEIALGLGDVLLTKDGATIGICNVVRELPELATVNGSIAVITPGNELAGEFLYYVIISGYAQSIFDRLRGGMGVPHLFQSDIKRVRIPLPPLDEQIAIADYLDEQTLRIDTLIAKQNQLIDTLRERRGAVVESAVLGESAVENGRRLKHVTLDVRQGWSPQCLSRAVDGRDTWAVLKAGAANAGRFRPEENKQLPPELEPRPETVVREGDLLISRANTRSLVGSAAVVTGNYPKLMLCDKLYALRLDPLSALPDYVSAVLGTRAIRERIEVLAGGTSPSMQNISREDIGNLPLDLPTIARQGEVLRVLDFQTTKIDALIAKTQKHIALAKERRAALITAAVTGQFDVRTVAQKVGA